MTYVKKALPAAVVLAAALAAGCGGGNDDALSKDEFVKQGNAACAKYAAAAKQIGDPKTIDDIPRLVDATVREFDTMISSLKDIQAPDDLSADYDKLLGTAEDAKGTFGELKSAAEAKDGKKLDAVAAKASATDKESDALATKLGLDACAKI
jgi:hypothetical protein